MPADRREDELVEQPADVQRRRLLLRVSQHPADRAVGRSGDQRQHPHDAQCLRIGAKTSWWNNRLTFNVAGFYSEYRNIQLTVQSVDPVTNANIRTTRN